MRLSAAMRRPCARRNTASGRPRPGPNWPDSWSTSPAACIARACGGVNTWRWSVATALSSTPPCWPRSRWVPSRCRCTRTRWPPNASSRSTTPRCASAWWKTRSRSTRCWRSASAARSSATSTTTTRAACATTSTPASCRWSRSSRSAGPLPTATPSSSAPKSARPMPTTWPPCSSPAAPPATPRAWCTRTTRCSTGRGRAPSSTA